jgi:hypothetical protein
LTAFVFPLEVARGRRRISKVVRTNGRRHEVLAGAINLLIGRAAFETANKRMYGGTGSNIGTGLGS